MSIAILVATLAIAAYSAMDAVMKALTLDIGVYNAMLWRMAVASVISGALWLGLRSPMPSRAALRIHLIRGVMSSLMAILFFWGLARVPLAQGVALAFVAPLIALYLAALVLKETIQQRAILGSLLGFAGVLVIMFGQAQANLGSEAFWGALSILGSAMFYAWNIVLMRQQALVAKPLEATLFTGLVITACYLPFAPLWVALPPSDQYGPILLAAIFGVLALMLLSWAYARAEAQYLAPVEYTAFIWAVLLGFLVFAEPVRPLTILGAAMIVAACLFAARKRPAPVADCEAAL
jgi:S-adenosylmethionine uptake transporter